MTLYSLSARPRISIREVGVSVVAAAIAGYAVVHASGSRLHFVELLVVALVASALFAWPKIATVALGAAIPAFEDLSGGGLGAHVTASDIVLVVATVRIFCDIVLTQRSEPMAAMR